MARFCGRGPLWAHTSHPRPHSKGAHVQAALCKLDCMSGAGGACGFSVDLGSSPQLGMSSGCWPALCPPCPSQARPARPRLRAAVPVQRLGSATRRPSRLASSLGRHRSPSPAALVPCHAPSGALPASGFGGKGVLSPATAALRGLCCLLRARGPGPRPPHPGLATHLRLFQLIFSADPRCEPGTPPHTQAANGSDVQTPPPLQ